MEGELQRTVGRNLRAHRVSRGLSQEDFADQVGVHRTYLGGLERGERNLTLQSLERLADHLGVPPLELLLDRDTRVPTGSATCACHHASPHRDQADEARSAARA
jgi:transcriptional regulator with XRE-family HTH domain